MNSNTDTPIESREPKWFWTDELVKEFYEKWHGDKHYNQVINDLLPKAIDQFKATHRDSGEDKGWEILALVDKEGRTTRSVSMIDFFVSQEDRGEINIQSVKRLADNSVWSIRDKTGAYGRDSVKLEIVKFYSNNNEMWVELSFEGYPPINVPLTSLNKLPASVEPKPVSVPLFVTDDGVKLFEKKDTVLVVDKKTKKYHEQHHGNTIGTWLNGWYTTDVIKNPDPDGKDKEAIKNIIKERYLFFASKTEAQEWIIVNTSCLSYQDVMKCMIKNENNAEFLHKGNLRLLAKEKIKG